jgi:Holliday junction resolvase-like predicted endonuclease
MTTVAIWQVTDAGLRRLESAPLDLEKQLEDWIDQDPDLVQFGLRILGRQVQVDTGPLDLLALDPQGRWCVIEIKRDTVDRATLAQVQDYASCLSEMSEEQLRACLQPHLEKRKLDLDEELLKRDATDSLDPKDRQVVMFVVGTARAPGLDRMLRFLSGFTVPIYAKLFNVFVTSQGDRVLVRETAEGEVPQVVSERWQTASLQQIRAIAETGGFAEVFDTIKEVADKHRLQSRPWKRSVMFAPPADGRRCLFTVWTTPQRDGLQIYVEPKAFAEFFPVSEEQAQRELGMHGYRTVGAKDARKFSEGLDRLLAAPTV